METLAMLSSWGKYAIKELRLDKEEKNNLRNFIEKHDKCKMSLKDFEESGITPLFYSMEVSVSLLTTPNSVSNSETCAS